MMEAQCWICPKCNYDHSQNDVCYHAELLETEKRLKDVEYEFKRLKHNMSNIRRATDDIPKLEDINTMARMALDGLEDLP